MRYLIKFTKEDQIKFISHLDLMRTIQRIIRRGNLPIEYSKGFNPHMSLSIANPLSVGVYSAGEYMDIVLTEELKEDEVRDRLNENSPQGIKFLEVKKVINIPNEKKVPQSMALIDAARYTIKIKYDNVETVEKEIEELNKKDEWITTKKSKKGEKTLNIKNMVKEMKYWVNDNVLIINAILSCGSREHLSPELLSNHIKHNTQRSNEDAFVEIKREEMLAYKNNKLVPLYQYI
ncbi:TIGR03936 family radical SAM-associated protein [Clostridium polyendosporum]|uniref:TIGR03936 family radical SAM-associated protein n=1 Tax=Clostridium polyendosporum TaxID=69208 RepID=UPI001BB3293D|nr:TIGR03936 family radical SAM-associated protein [Clostridium polyendosporum]